MIDVGILTPHAGAEADDEFCVMAGRAVRTHVRRISLLPDVGVCSTPASAVDALRRIGAERLAVVHPPWFGKDLNSRGASYFGDQGFSVGCAVLADVTDDPALVEPAEVVEWVAENVPVDADAVFLGGNGFRAARAVGPLEQHLDRPVLESKQVLLWSVNESLGTPVLVRGFGRLLEPGREDAS